MNDTTIYRATDLSPELLGLDLPYLSIAVAGAGAAFVLVMTLAALGAGVMASTGTGAAVAVSSFLAARRLERRHRTSGTSIHALLASRRHPSSIIPHGTIRTVITEVSSRRR